MSTGARVDVARFTEAAGVYVFAVHWLGVLLWARRAGYAIDEVNGLSILDVHDVDALVAEWDLAGAPGLQRVAPRAR